jgi:hypothetical protein
VNRQGCKGRQLWNAEKLQRPADRVMDGLADLLQTVHLRKVLSLPERYLDGKIALHLHFRFGADDGERAPGDLCAVFERHPGLVDRLRGSDVLDANQDSLGVFGLCGGRCDYRSVLVHIRERTEVVERVNSMPVRSVVRLQRLDRCKEGALGIEARKRAALLASRGDDDPAEEVVPVVVERKARPFRDLGNCVADEWSKLDRKQWTKSPQVTLISTGGTRLTVTQMS